MANVFTPDNTKPTPPALGNTGEVGGNGSAPITLLAQCSQASSCGSNEGSGCTAGGGTAGAGDCGCGGDTTAGGGTAAGDTGGTAGGGGGGTAGGGGAINRGWSPYGGPGGGGSVSPRPGGAITWSPMNGPIGPAPMPGPIDQGGAGCGCGGAPGGGGGLPGGGGGNSPVGSGPSWTLRGNGGPGGGVGGTIWSPMDGPIGPIGKSGGSGGGTVTGTGPGGTGTTSASGSCGTCSPAGTGTGAGTGGPPGGGTYWPPIPRGTGGGGQGGLTPPIAMTPFGGGQAALQRAASMPSVGRSGALPPLTFAVGGCNSLGGSCVINPANPSVAMQISPPAGDLFYIRPVFSYCSLNTGTVNELGTGWFHTFKRQVQVATHTLTVVTGAGQSFTYSRTPLGGFNAPTSNTVNSLQAPSNASTATETQPDGTLYQYSTSGGGLSLQYIQNPAGARWTVTYDGIGRVSFVKDPIGRLTTFAYNATSGKISSVQDPFGRLSTITVDSSGNLVQLLSPELCLSRHGLRYEPPHDCMD